MPTNEEFKRGIAVPLTVGASVPARNPVAVGQIVGITLTKTAASGTTRATVLRKGVVALLVEGETDAVKLTFATVTNGQTIIFNGDTYTAHTNTTVVGSRQFSIAGDDGADVDEFLKCVNGSPGSSGVVGIKGTGGVCYLVSESTISAITGTASGATVTVDHEAVYENEVTEGDVLYWKGTNAAPHVGMWPSGVRFGYALQAVKHRAMNLATVTNGQTIVFTLPDGSTVTFTAHTNTTDVTKRQFSIAGTDSQDADEFIKCLASERYGIKGLTATNDGGTVSFVCDNDIAISGTAVDGGTCVPKVGSRKINVKLGW